MYCNDVKGTVASIPSFLYDFSRSAEQSELSRVEVVYLTMPGWKKSIAHSKSISDLPPNAKAYVEKIWELTGIPGNENTILIRGHWNRR